MNILNQYNNDVIVFDIGGTYFRSGIYTASEHLEEVQQQVAPSFLIFPNASIEDLKQKLIDYLIKTARCYQSKFQAKHVSVSLGAALDGNRGVVYGSGPLWGKDCSPFDLAEQLKQVAPEFCWHVVNDVTAALLHYVSHINDATVRKVLLLTVSTGIACRLFDLRSRTIALNEFGLQGEIGHLPVSLSLDGQTFELNCDCGEHNHLAAFASGRGLLGLIKSLAQRKPALWQASRFAELQAQGLSFDLALSQALDVVDGFAITLLYLATKNIADILRNALTMDPEIDRIVLTGGVAVNLAVHYRAMLMRHFSENGLYLSSYFDPQIFERRIVIDKGGEANNLIGAALYATTYSKQRCYV